MPTLAGPKSRTWEGSSAPGEIKQMGKSKQERWKMQLGNDLKPAGEESSEHRQPPRCAAAPGTSTVGAAPACWLPRQRHSTPGRAPVPARPLGTRAIPTPVHTTHLTARQLPAANPSVAAALWARWRREGQGELTNPWTEARHPTDTSQTQVTGTREKTDTDRYVCLRACIQVWEERARKLRKREKKYPHREEEKEPKNGQQGPEKGRNNKNQ